MTATVLITRPTAQANAFATALEIAHGGPERTVISPLMEIVPTKVQGRFDDLAHVVFTSVNGVSASVPLNLPKTAIAWCVGSRTAEAAQKAGFSTRNALGNSDDLVSLIVAAKPVTRMVHVRGQHVAGTVTDSLKEAGIICETVVAYDQVACPPTQAAIDLLNGANPVIVPLFSPRSAKLLVELVDITAPLHLILISAAVNLTDQDALILSRAVVQTNKRDGMIDETLLRYAQNSP